jgi:uncharacterized damage-inducible protein DinB
MKKITSLLLAIMLMTGAANAQSISLDTIRAQLVKDWERAKSYTNEYLAAMPADKYGARAQDSVRTFSEQMLHLSMGNISLTSAGTGTARIFPGFNIEKSPGAQNKDSVTYYVNASYDFAINGIKNMDVNKLTEYTRNQSRLVWLLKAFEHQTHHRGQCTIYIRLQGIKPPNERLF